MLGERTQSSDMGKGESVDKVDIKRDCSQIKRFLELT